MKTKKLVASKLIELVKFLMCRSNEADISSVSLLSGSLSLIKDLLMLKTSVISSLWTFDPIQLILYQLLMLVVIP